MIVSLLQERGHGDNNGHSSAGLHRCSVQTLKMSKDNQPVNCSDASRQIAKPV